MNKTFDDAMAFEEIDDNTINNSGVNQSVNLGNKTEITGKLAN